MQSRAKHIRPFGMVYNHPQLGDVSGGINVSVRDVTTVCAAKVFAFSITEMFAHATGLARIVRVNHNQWDTGKMGLVFKKRTKLAERPRVMFPSLSFSDRRSVSNSSQVLNCNALLFDFGLTYNVLCYRVIGDSGMSVFFTGEPFQELFSSFRAFALNGSTHLELFVSNSVQIIRTKVRSIGKRGYVRDPKINTNKLFNVGNFFFGNLNSLKQVKLTFSGNKISFPLDIGNVLGIVADKWHLQSATHRPDRNRIFFIRKNAIIIGDCTQRFKVAFTFLVKFIGIGNLGDAPDKHLGRQSRASFEAMVHKAMKFKLIECLFTPRNIRNFITDLVASLDSFQERCSLFICRQELYLQRKFHALNIFQVFEKVKGNFNKKGGKGNSSAS